MRSRMSCSSSQEESDTCCRVSTYGNPNRIPSSLNLASRVHEPRQRILCKNQTSAGCATKGDDGHWTHTSSFVSVFFDFLALRFSTFVHSLVLVESALEEVAGAFAGSCEAGESGPCTLRPSKTSLGFFAPGGDGSVCLRFIWQGCCPVDYSGGRAVRE
jgi:hypothetical protein